MPIVIQVLEHRRTWREILWRMADGSKSEYERLAATSILEFWGLFDLWRADVKRELDSLKHNKHA